MTAPGPWIPVDGQQPAVQVLGYFHQSCDQRTDPFGEAVRVLRAGRYTGSA